jgi:hypothetical protein
MCRRIDLTIDLDALLSVAPTDCDDGGAACRSLSAPFLALGTVRSDVDLILSHVVAINLEIKDTAALDRAAEACGMVAVQTDEFAWWGRWQQDYSGEDAAYRRGISPEEYGKCQYALAQADSPLGKAELAARAAGRRLSPAEVEAVRVQAHGQGWRTNRTKPYEVGVVANAEAPGTFRLVLDDYGGGYGLVARVGAKACKLRQHYAAEAAVGVATRQGHVVLERSVDAQGRLKILLDATPKAARVTLG